MTLKSVPSWVIRNEYDDELIAINDSSNLLKKKEEKERNKRDEVYESMSN